MSLKKLINTGLMGCLLILAPLSQASALYSYTYPNFYDPKATAGASFASAINISGMAIGGFNNATGSYNFFYNGSTYTTLDVVGVLGRGVIKYTDVQGINDNGQVVGMYGDGIGVHGYLYNGSTYTDIIDPSATGGFPYEVGTNTYARGINNNGQVVGSFGNSNGEHGFIYSNGIYTTLDVPNSNLTNATGINDSGQVTGYFYNDTGVHGFLYSNSIYTTIDSPNGGFGTHLTGINNNGQVLGYSDNPAIGTQSFVYSNGIFITIEVPNARTTIISSINNNGQVLGAFNDGIGYYGISHNFIATPSAVPVPSAISLFVSSLGLLSFVSRKNKNNNFLNK